MKKVVRLFTTLGCALGCAIALLAAAEPAEAGTYVTIHTIAGQSVAQGETVRVRPNVKARTGVRIESKVITAKRGSTYLAVRRLSAALPAGSYRVTVRVRYRVKSGRKYGRLREAQRTQDLKITTLPEAVVVPPVEPEPVVAPAETQVQSAPSTPCGVLTETKADGSAWNCAFSDEFTGTALDPSKWRVQLTELDGVHTGPECWVDSPDNIAVAGGTLRLTTRQEPEPFTCKSPYGDYTSSYTGASVNTWGHFSQTYGRFEFRAKFPDVKVAGTHGALWLYPESTATYGGDGASGEIDVAEVYSVHPDRAIPYIHYNSTPDDNTVTAWDCMINPATFHTYTAVWTPQSITISYDGKVCRVHNINPLAPLIGSEPFDRPFIAVMTQTLGVTGTTNEFAPGSTPLPATMEVDYVRIWS